MKQTVYVFLAVILAKKISDDVWLAFITGAIGHLFIYASAAAISGLFYVTFARWQFGNAKRPDSSTSSGS
jgi:hypothetical protein